MSGALKLDEQQEGALITGVAIGSTAADNNINAGSVIVQVRRTVVTSPDDVLENIGKERDQKNSSVPMLIAEPSGLRWVSLQLS
jgi:S1-C subfamily serine protease